MSDFFKKDKERDAVIGNIMRSKGIDPDKYDNIRIDTSQELDNINESDYIYLQEKSDPEYNEDTGQLWCQDSVFEKSVKYVRVEALTNHNDVGNGDLEKIRNWALLNQISVIEHKEEMKVKDLKWHFSAIPSVYFFKFIDELINLPTQVQELFDKLRIEMDKNPNYPKEVKMGTRFVIENKEPTDWDHHFKKDKSC